MNKTYEINWINMVENILVAGAVILAFYIIVRFILKRLAGDGEVNPCHGCSGCSMGKNPQVEQACENPLGDACKTVSTEKD